MRRKTGDFTQGSIPGVILGMALPLIAAQLVNVLYNVVDRIYIGHIAGTGDLALTGVGVALPVITVVSAFAGLFGQGGAPLCSIARGRGDTDEAERIMGNSLTMILLSSVVLMIAAWVARTPVLMALGATESTIGYARDYLTVYLIGTPFALVSLGMNPYINVQGFPRRGMMTVLLGAAANILLDPLFIFTLGMGVRGAAAATVLSQILSAAWCLGFLLGKKALLRLRWEVMRPLWRVIRRIMSLGVTNFVMIATNSVVQAIANRQLVAFGGDLYVGAMTIINSLRTVMTEVIHGLSGGTQPVLGFNYGAGEKRRVLEGIRFNTLAGIVFTTLTWALFELFAPFFVGIFTTQQELARTAVRAVRIYFCGITFMALQFAAQSVFQGLGRAREAITFSLLRKIVIVVPLMLFLPGLGLGADGVFWSEPISDLLGGGIAFVTMLLTVYRPISRSLKEDETCQN